jgi:hypothetical protein
VAIRDPKKRAILAERIFMFVLKVEITAVDPHPPVDDVIFSPLVAFRKLDLGQRGLKLSVMKSRLKSQPTRYIYEMV